MSDFDIFLEFSTYFDGVRELIYQNWKSPADAFEEWKQVSRGQLCDYSGMNYEMMESHGGIQWPCNEQFPLGSARLYTPDIGFRTPDVKAKLLCLEWIPLQEPSNEKFPLILNTGRTVEQWHTRTKTGDIAILNDLAPEAWVDINPADALALEVKSGDRLAISSPRGRVENIVVRVTQTVREGNVFVPFHFNTQLINILTPSQFDHKSGEPNYKQTAVQLHSQKHPEGLCVDKQMTMTQLGYVEKTKWDSKIKKSIYTLSE